MHTPTPRYSHALNNFAMLYMHSSPSIILRVFEFYVHTFFHLHYLHSRILKKITDFRFQRIHEYIEIFNNFFIFWKFWNYNFSFFVSNFSLECILSIEHICKNHFCRNFFCHFRRRFIEDSFYKYFIKFGVGVKFKTKAKYVNYVL